MREEQGPDRDSGGGCAGIDRLGDRQVRHRNHVVAGGCVGNEYHRHRAPIRRRRRERDGDWLDLVPRSADGKLVRMLAIATRLYPPLNGSETVPDLTAIYVEAPR